MTSRPRDLPNVTLVAIDCVAHDLTRLALEDTLDQINPRTLLVYSNSQIAVPLRNCPPSHAYRPTACRSLSDVARVIWHEVPRELHTTHALFVQYDGWVLDGRLWRDSWLEYDYIGAPWPWYPDRPVGNGGFSLRSCRLLHWLATHRASFPLLAGYAEDDLLCRYYRPALEATGFRFAPEEVGQAFAFEHDAPHSAFGFHGFFNLTREQLSARSAFVNAYVKAKPDWAELLFRLKCRVDRAPLPGRRGDRSSRAN